MVWRMVMDKQAQVREAAAARIGEHAAPPVAARTAVPLGSQCMASLAPPAVQLIGLQCRAGRCCMPGCDRTA